MSRAWLRIICIQELLLLRVSWNPPDFPAIYKIYHYRLPSSAPYIEGGALPDELVAQILKEQLLVY